MALGSAQVTRSLSGARARRLSLGRVVDGPFDRGRCLAHLRAATASPASHNDQ